jgi:hypothetical protein
MIRFEVTTSGDPAVLKRIQDGLSNRARLHARIADAAENFSKDYVQKLHSRDEEHETANRLGAKRTGEFLRISKAIESESNESAAVLRFPRASRIRAAFGGYTVRPVKVKYLTIPAHRLTYGMRAREFDNLEFRFLGRHKALVFSSGPETGKVAYWLTKERTIKEDRGLLPFPQYPKLASRVAVAYVQELTQGGAA